MSYRIYIEKRCLVICQKGKGDIAGSDHITFKPSGDSGIHELVEMFKNSPSVGTICFPAEDTEAAYREVCSEFKEVNAGGGLVRNKRGEYLLIKRNGLWDLPKGHQEQGEDIRETSVREVQEETGACGLELKDLICITDHCYIRNGRWHLKHTWWYGMTYDKTAQLTPQIEEDITETLWTDESELPSLLENTYPSIVEVFHNVCKKETKS